MITICSSFVLQFDLLNTLGRELFENVYANFVDSCQNMGSCLVALAWDATKAAYASQARPERGGRGATRVAYSKHPGAETDL